MQRVIDQIRSEKEALAEVDFFPWVAEPSRDDHDKLAFVPCMYAYVMGFRDLLNLITGPEDGGLQSAVNAYVAEDASHYRWYLEDLRKVHPEPVDPSYLFDERLLPSRRAIYRMIGYAMDHDDVVLRTVLVMIFEATGEVFLRHTRALVRRLGLDEELGYFGTLHYEDELAHSVKMEELAAIRLTDEQYRLASEMVRRAFAEYHGLFRSWREGALAQGTEAKVFDGRALRPAVAG